MKKIEPVFDIAYLISGAVMGIIMLTKASQGNIWILAGFTALTLIIGDSFHLVPRVIAVFSDKPDKYQSALGRGRQITSITMTIFYLLLWHTVIMYVPGVNNMTITVLLYILAVIRIIVCFMPGNKWIEKDSPISYSLYRNVPFFIMGAVVVISGFINSQLMGVYYFLWLAVLLSFAFYAPVTLFASKHKMLGMLMLPKTCMYVWILTMLMRM